MAAVTTRTGVDALEAVLTAKGIPVTKLGPELTAGLGVRLATTHRLKGLEFRCGAVADADDDNVPLPAALTNRTVDEAQHLADVRRERCLPYVACTRARDELWVGWSGKRSRFIADDKSG